VAEADPMIYKFRCKVDGDIVMMQATGERVLAAIGKPPGPRGILEPAQMPDALLALEAAIEADDRSRSAGSDGDDGGGSGGGRDPISLRRRAWPLLEMIRRARAAGEPVVWGV